MAIEKIFVGNDATLITALLTEYGVPKYFTEVTRYGGVITCTIEGGRSIGFDISREKLYINNAEYAGRANTSDHLKYIYVCENAICIAYEEDIFSVVITKDNEGKTVFIWTDKLAGVDENSNRYVFTYNAASTYIMRSHQTYTKHNLTSMCPMVVGDTDNYTPNVYAVMYSQVYGNYTIQLGGVNYLTNGIWCIKDSSSE